MITPNCHIGDFSGEIKRKGETFTFNYCPINIFLSSTFIGKVRVLLLQSVTPLLSLQYDLGSKIDGIPSLIEISGCNNKVLCCFNQYILKLF